jgi:hypothetical protein
MAKARAHLLKQPTKKLLLILRTRLKYLERKKRRKDNRNDKALSAAFLAKSEIYVRGMRRTKLKKKLKRNPK